MNKNKRVKSLIMGTAISLTMASTVLINACSETKEEKVVEKVNVEPTPIPTAGDKVNVNVHVDQPAQQPVVAAETKKTEITNIVVDKKDNTRMNNDMANVNANLAKLQSQVKSANEQSKAQLNKQIQQMNLEKLKLQKEIASFQVKNKELSNQAQQQKANMDATSATKTNTDKSGDQMQQSKQDYIKLSQARLDNFQLKMDKVKDKANYLEATQKADVDKQISRIDEQKDAVNQKITDLDSISDPSAFKTARTQIDTMISGLEKTYNNLVTDKVSLK